METLHRRRFLSMDVNKQDIDLFIEQANTFYPTRKFTAEISVKEIILLDTVVYKGERFLNEAILNVKTHYKPTETFQYTHYSSNHLQGVKRGFVKGGVIRLLRRNSSEKKISGGHDHLRHVVTPKTKLKERY